MKPPNYNVVILVICAIIVVTSFTFHLDQIGVAIFGFKWHMHCFLNHFFGIKCALCGMTRSFCAFGHGNFSKSLEYHRLGPLFFSFIVLQIPYRMWAIVIRPKRIKAKIRKVHAVFAVIVFTAIFLNWIFYLGGRLL